ncbi:MAG: hypothetical protein LKG19_10480 [Saprospiraceae bacterium]|jgi:hypothetical protein|nr:hypothetical protein [Saprospiraceae bacterium]
MLKKSRELIISLTIAYIGAFVMYLSHFLSERMDNGIGILLGESGQVLLIASVFYYFFQKLNNKVDNYQEHSQDLMNIGVKAIRVTNSNPFRVITDEILKNKNIYRISIYLQNPSLENFVHIKELLYRNEILTKVRLLISTPEHDLKLSIEKEIKSINKIGGKAIETCFIESEISNSFVLVDMSLWIIYQNKTEFLENAVCLNINAESETGETLAKIFNNNWQKGIKISNL